MPFPQKKPNYQLSGCVPRWPICLVVGNYGFSQCFSPLKPALLLLIRASPEYYNPQTLSLSPKLAAIADHVHFFIASPEEGIGVVQQSWNEQNEHSCSLRYSKRFQGLETSEAFAKLIMLSFQLVIMQSDEANSLDTISRFFFLPRQMRPTAEDLGSF